jgi:AcrR family transcriptional regulator
MESPPRSAARRKTSAGSKTPAGSAKKSKLARPSRTAIRRDTIVREAAKLFLDRGYENVSINDIIDVVGGSKGTIYSNFGSKEKLFEAVVQRMCADVTIQIDANPSGAIEAQLARMGKSFLTNVISPQTLRFHRLVTSIGRTFPEAGRMFYNTGPRTVYRIFSDWIALQQKQDAIRSDEDPHRLAVLFHDMLIGEHILSWLTSAASEKDRLKRVDKTVELAVRVFLQGCARR